MYLKTEEMCFNRMINTNYLVGST